MIFNDTEVCIIVKQHIMDKWGVAEKAIKEITLSTQHKGCVMAEVVTWAEGGGPYRSAPKPQKG